MSTRVPNNDSSAKADHEHAARRVREPRLDAERRTDVPERQEHRQRGAQPEHETDDVPHPDVAPPAAVETEDDPDQQLHPDHHQEVRLEGLVELRRNRELEPQQAGEGVAGGESDCVKRKKDGHAPGGQAEQEEVEEGLRVGGHGKTAIIITLILGRQERGARNCARAEVEADVAVKCPTT
jgi:hypothetical protein